jgi:hypothetical protein
MAWSTPLTAVSNATLTAAQWNASVRDNMLETPAAKATAAGSMFASTAANSIAERIPSTATVSTGQSSAITSYGDLATAGPAVTVTTGPKALVAIGCVLTTDTTGIRAYMSYAVSGATTVAAADDVAVVNDASAASKIIGASRVSMPTLTAGSNTFTSKYRVTSTNGTWSQRNMVVLPF